MTRARSHLALAVAIPLAIALLTAAYAQNSGSNRQTHSGSRRGTFLGLLSVQEVQQELKLSDAQIAKVKQLSETSRAEARDKYAALREIEDRQRRHVEMAQLAEQRDEQARDQARKLLSDEQMARLYQIRLQVRGAVYGLNNPWVAKRLELTSEQKEKAAELAKQTRENVSEAYHTLRDVMQNDRREKFDDALQNVRKIRSDANERSLALLTTEQRKMFGELEGEQFKL